LCSDRPLLTLGRTFRSLQRFCRILEFEKLVFESSYVQHFSSVALE
jgi:hypothetical protein